MNNDSNRKIEECIEYFRKNKAFQRIFLEMRKKWKKYGRVSGYIIVDSSTELERRALSAVLGRTIEEKTIKFKMSEFEKALNETRYSGISMMQLLEGYFNESLITNKSERVKASESKKQFFEDLRDYLLKDQQYSEAVKVWLDNIVETKSSGYNLIIVEYEKDGHKAFEMLINVCKAVNYLEQQSEKRIRLAVLSALITTKPHYFDRGNVEGRLLLNALCSINHCEYPNDAELVLELYYNSGIQPDGISSYTAAYGISLYTESGRHKAYEGFIEEKEDYLITLSNLNRIIKADCRSKKVFVIENQMVFSHLCENVKGLEVSMICTSGQLKTASLMLIDLLCKSGCTLYYSGDIDPEGIIIADKLVSRGYGQIIPWRFGITDYVDSISDKEIGPIRLKKLKKVQNSELQIIANEVVKHKKAGYQELLIDKMQEDIKQIMI